MSFYFVSFTRAFAGGYQSNGSSLRWPGIVYVPVRGVASRQFERDETHDVDTKTRDGDYCLALTWKRKTSTASYLAFESNDCPPGTLTSPNSFQFYPTSFELQPPSTESLLNRVRSICLFLGETRDVFRWSTPHLDSPAAAHSCKLRSLRKSGHLPDYGAHNDLTGAFEPQLHASMEYSACAQPAPQVGDGGLGSAKPNAH
ncbi:hypothetical protein HYFRA_00004898 [Hymenoscyphus fraxineus]|uniref:Uncharacterized protein n=1 Tax=Hymenoscyphus fraxineus TaxID=746836 RepID=A0A9N9KM87_9HELO|nr:hypothetical protein HYFRA_00004898 [Hymenoscyphus fraxineus]